MATADDVDRLIERYQRGLGDFMKGDPEPVKGLFSHEEDVTLANPLGPPAHGWDEVAATIEHAASQFRDGRLVGVEINFQSWRFHHMKTVERIIGAKAGTGGTSGVKFRAKALDTTFVPELIEVRSRIG